MKRLGIFNQYKIIKFIEKHILTFKKTFKICKNSRLHKTTNKNILKTVASNKKNMGNLYIEVCLLHKFRL